VAGFLRVHAEEEVKGLAVGVGVLGGLVLFEAFEYVRG
jgi:hypothetical protein